MILSQYISNLGHNLMWSPKWAQLYDKYALRIAVAERDRDFEELRVISEELGLDYDCDLDYSSLKRPVSFISLWR